MSAYRFWTLTCDGCGEVFDVGIQPTVTGCKKEARRHGWLTGRNRFDDDFCPHCKVAHDASESEDE